MILNIAVLSPFDQNNTASLKTIDALGTSFSHVTITARLHST